MFVFDIFTETPKTWLPAIDPGGWFSAKEGLPFFTGKVGPFLVNGGLFLVIILSFIFLLIGGTMWILAGGNKEGLAKAKATVTYALIGFVLGLSSFLILRILEVFFHIPGHLT